MNANIERLYRLIPNSNIEACNNLIQDLETDSLNLPMKNGMTPLMMAVEHNKFDIVKCLIDKGVSINVTGYDGVTALHIAVDISIDGTIQSGKKEGEEPTDIILYLLNAGADTSKPDMNGKTPIDWAHDYRSKKIINLLKNNG